MKMLVTDDSITMDKDAWAWILLRSSARMDAGVPFPEKRDWAYGYWDAIKDNIVAGRRPPEFKYFPIAGFSAIADAIQMEEQRGAPIFSYDQIMACVDPNIKPLDW